MEKEFDEIYTWKINWIIFYSLKEFLLKKRCIIIQVANLILKVKLVICFKVE